MLYNPKPILPYADDYYGVLPPGLPENFYPKDPKQRHAEEDYVLCFNENVSEDMKQRIIKDYAEYYRKQKESGLY